MSNGSVTNRLHMLERERKRLELELADDPHWQAFCDAQRRNPAAGRLHVLSSDIVAGLTQSPCFAEYVKVVRAIERIRASARPARAAATAPEPDGGEPAFRTRLHVKPAAGTEQQQPGDDLTAIRGIDGDLASALSDLGFRTYRAIAELDRNSVRFIRDTLQLDKRIWRENWIEQAALLHRRQLSAPTAVTLEPVPVATDTEPPPIKLVAVTVPETPQPSMQPPLDGVEPIEREASAAQSDNATPGDVPAPDLHPLVQSNDNEPATEPAPPPPAAPEELLASEEADAADAMAPAPRTTIKVGRRPPRLPAPATRRFGYLYGVSDQLAEALRSAGVNSLADIASWTRSDVRWFQAILGDAARIAHDQWIEQATLLSRGIWTRHALRVVNGETRLVVGYPAPLVAGAPAIGSVPTRAAPDDEAATDDTTAPVNEAPPRAAAALAARSPALVSPPVEPDPALTHATPALVPEATSNETGPTEPTAPVDATAVEPHHAEAAPPAAPNDDALAAAADASTASGKDATLDARPRQSALTPRPASLANAVPGAEPRRRPVSTTLGRIKRPPPDLGLGKPRLRPTGRTTPPPLPPPVPTPATPPDVTISFRRPSAPVVDKPAPPLPPVDDTPPLPVGDDAHPVVDARQDWDDAEALLIKRSEPVVAAAAEPTSGAPAPAAVPVDSADTEDAAPGDAGDAADWGSEAEVVIVARARSDMTAAAGARNDQPATPADAVVAPVRLSASRRRSDGAGASQPQIGYSEAVEEASVTIIRAEASQEDAGVVPNDIANDAETPGQTASKPAVRSIGSRFLKALTGD